MYKRLTLFLLIAAACNRQGGEPVETAVIAKVPVTVASIGVGEMADYLDITATSVFQVKTVVRSTVGGFVEDQLVNVGETVARNKEIFRLRTKESASVRPDSANKLAFSGMIPVRAVLDGVVISIDHPKGDYVQEGDQLAAIALPASLVFVMEVPYESCGFIHPGSACEVLLPGGEKIDGQVKSLLPSMNNNAQTQRFIIGLTGSHHLPENLVARVRIVRKMNPKAVTLPKGCLLSDEVQQNFWVMKLVSDTLAVRVTVIPGMHDQEAVEITEPVFSATDRFLATGNYGLGDTARVVIQGTFRKQ